MLKDYLIAAGRSGLDVKVDAYRAEDLTEMFGLGLMPLKSLDLLSRFLFVKVDAGRGFFGGQKVHILSYRAEYATDEYAPGPSFSALSVALTSINNIYRKQGLLKGSAV